MFLLHERCGIPYDVAWRMPVAVRRWWFSRKLREDQERRKSESGPGAPAPMPAGLRAGAKPR